MSLAKIRELGEWVQLAKNYAPGQHSDDGNPPLQMEALEKAAAIVAGMKHDAKATRDVELRDDLATHAPPMPEWFAAEYHADYAKDRVAEWPWHYADMVLAKRIPTTGDDADGKEEG